VRAPRALLLDLDGTLADTLPGLADAVNRLRARLDLRPLPAGEIRRHLGDGARDLLMKCTGLDGDSADLHLGPWRADYLERCTTGTALLPGAADLLAAAAARGIPAAVVTNKPLLPSERILAALGIRGRFAAVVGGDSLPVRKPDPAMVIEALRLLGSVPPAEAWLVGDGPQDIAAARAAGCAGILDRGYGDLAAARAHGPAREVEGLPDLLPLPA
jgi:phosphoglycolate phosphatase